MRCTCDIVYFMNPRKRNKKYIHSHITHTTGTSLKCQLKEGGCIASTFPHKYTLYSIIAFAQALLRRASASGRRCSIAWARPGRRSASSQNALQTASTAPRSATLPQVTVGVSGWTVAGRCQAHPRGNQSVWIIHLLCFLGYKHNIYSPLM